MLDFQLLFLIITKGVNRAEQFVSLILQLQFNFSFYLIHSHIDKALDLLTIPYVFIALGFLGAQVIFQIGDANLQVALHFEKIVHLNLPVLLSTVLAYIFVAVTLALVHVCIGATLQACRLVAKSHARWLVH